MIGGRPGPPVVDSRPSPNRSTVVDAPVPPTWIFPLLVLPLLAVWIVGLILAWPRRGRSEGEVVVEGEPDALSRRLAERLAASGAGIPALRLTTRTPDLVKAERPSTLPSPYERLEVHLSQEGSGVRFRWRLEAPRLVRLQRGLTLGVGLLYGGLFAVGVPVVVGLLVLPADDPAIRWQVIQTVQMIHGVWPAYVVALLFWILRSAARRAVEIRIGNLPHGT